MGAVVPLAEKPCVYCEGWFGQEGGVAGENVAAGEEAGEIIVRFQKIEILPEFETVAARHVRQRVHRLVARTCW